MDEKMLIITICAFFIGQNLFVDCTIKRTYFRWRSLFFKNGKCDRVPSSVFKAHCFRTMHKLTLRQMVYTYNSTYAPGECAFPQRINKRGSTEFFFDCGDACISNLYPSLEECRLACMTSWKEPFRGNGQGQNAEVPNEGGDQRQRVSFDPEMAVKTYRITDEELPTYFDWIDGTGAYKTDDDHDQPGPSHASGSNAPRNERSIENQKPDWISEGETERYPPRCWKQIAGTQSEIVQHGPQITKEANSEENIGEIGTRPGEYADLLAISSQGQVCEVTIEQCSPHIVTSNEENASESPQENTKSSELS